MTKREDLDKQKVITELLEMSCKSLAFPPLQETSYNIKSDFRRQRSWVHSSPEFPRITNNIPTQIVGNYVHKSFFH